MRNMNERPICHRSEDLVTYLYGEAGEADARDFADHLRVCDACRSEFAVFQQMHDSIAQWRSEALGAVSFAPMSSPVVSPAFPEMTGAEKRLSAIASIREFFNVSPFWLQGATALATVVFCVLVVFAVSRYWTGPATSTAGTAQPKMYTANEFDEAVKTAVEEWVAKSKGAETTTPPRASANGGQAQRIQRPSRPKSARLPQNRLTRGEREQLAADLRLLPSADDDDALFVLPNEQPNY